MEQRCQFKSLAPTHHVTNIHGKEQAKQTPHPLTFPTAAQNQRLWVKPLSLLPQTYELSSVGTDRQMGYQFLCTDPAAKQGLQRKTSEDFSYFLAYSSAFALNRNQLFPFSLVQHFQNRL